MGPIGIPELIFIFILALLIFGPKKLPELGRTVGKALTEFRRASNELRGAVEDEMRQLERETQEAKRSVEDTVARAIDSGEGSEPAPAPTPAPADEAVAEPNSEHREHRGTQNAENAESDAKPS